MVSAPRPAFFSTFRGVIVVILLTGIGGSVLAFRELRHKDEALAESEITRRAAFIHSSIGDLFALHEDMLHGLSTAYSLAGGVSQAEFVQLARSLQQRNPGVQALEWIPAVPAGRRSQAEAMLGEITGGPPVGFTERDASGRLVPAAARAEYYPITHVYPLAGNEGVLGYDLMRGPARTALDQARRTRQFTLTGQVRLLQEKTDQFGVIMIWPVYRPILPGAMGSTAEPAAFLGFVQAVYRIPDLLETVRVRNWGSTSILDLLFVDDTEADPARKVMFYRPNFPSAHAPTVTSVEEFRRPGHDRKYALEIGGRHWSILYRPYAGWFEHQLTPAPWVRVAGILTITGLLAGVVLLLGRRAEDIKLQVTERTAELTESRRQLSSLLHTLPGLAYRYQYGDQLKVIYLSVGVEVLTGFSAEEFLAGRVHFRDLIHPGDVERVRSVTRTALRNRHEIEVEYRLLTRDGTEKWVLSRGRGVYDEAGHALFLEGLAIDITARKLAEAAQLAMERRLLESQKLESLGLLAGGIAHDFNNILAGILGNASLARLKLTEDAVVMPHLRKIEQATARAAELCQQMLAYSGQSSFQILPVDLSHLVEETLPLLHVSLASRARLHLALSPRPVVAQADATQLRQIVMNLVINAADAMGERSGDIYITTGVRAISREFLQAAREGSELAPGDYVFLEVRDTGCGMTLGTLAKIFDPFFTTKFTGRGLGLAAVRGIVRGHHGALHVATLPGLGSTFTLLLRSSTHPVAPVGPASVPSGRYTGQVLIIDDDASVREAAAGLLHTFGFTTVAAEDGAAGFALFAIHPADFTLVLLDLTMPGMSGEETLTALRAIAPGVRVLLISGYSENSRVTRLAGTGPLRFMQKPFTRDDMARKLQELLG
jgi:two-component system cell cycle sensor histidine kinase/response regulator CckA